MTAVPLCQHDRRFKYTAVECTFECVLSAFVPGTFQEIPVWCGVVWCGVVWCGVKILAMMYPHNML